MRTEIYVKNDRVYVERQFDAGNKWITSTRFAAKTTAEACQRFPLYLHEAGTVLGTLPEPEEIAPALLCARWAEAMTLEMSEENLAAEREVLNRQFCLESGLVIALEDDTAPEVSKTVSDALAILSGDVPAHTCAEFPNLTCANPYCTHEPVTP